MNKYYLAIDIGASSGRHVLGCLKDGKIQIKEIFRFSNGTMKINGHRCWDTNHIYENVVAGIQECKRLDIIPEGIAIDTWGLDYVLLDRHDRILGNAVSYRDQRTKGIYDEIFKIISREELYQETGLQMAEFNTICQLMAVKRDNPEYLEEAKTFLMIPDYLNFLLTGVRKQEYSNATTTQLMNAKDCKWNLSLIERLGLPTKLFGEITMPGQVIGRLLPELEARVGFNVNVVIPPTHDTASAFMAMISDNSNTLCISSGTWSLMGQETKDTICTKESLECGFTNEGGYKGVIAYLKNSMGLWMIQQIREEMAPELEFYQICDLAEKESITSVVDANDNRFLGPESMIKEIQNFCKETCQSVPETVGEMSKVVYTSIAKSYNRILKEVEQIKGIEFKQINIMGGGSKADYLNRMTAAITEKTVLAGPDEATSIGNILCQMICHCEVKDLNEGRSIVKKSFDIKIYEGKGEEN